MGSFGESLRKVLRMSVSGGKSPQGSVEITMIYQINNLKKNAFE